jgi:hypothetical protein
VKDQKGRRPFGGDSQNADRKPLKFMILIIERWLRFKDMRGVNRCRRLVKRVGMGRALEIKEPRRATASDLA